MYLPIFSFWCIKYEYPRFDILHHVSPKEFFQSQSLAGGAINLKEIYFKINNTKFPVATEVRVTVNFGGVLTGKGHMGALRSWKYSAFLCRVVIARVYTHEKLSRAPDICVSYMCLTQFKLFNNIEFSITVSKVH